MSDNDSRRYVGRVQEEVHRHLREVLDDNHRLRLLVAGVRTENLTLHEQITRLREEVEGHRRQQLILHQQLVEVESSTSRFAQQSAQVEQQYSNLANLYVASYQLACTVDRDGILQSIQEIVANLIGSEEAGVYEVAEDGASLVLIASYGIDAIRHARVAIGKGTIGRTAETGELYVSPSGTPDHERITACIPLRAGDEMIGVIVVFGLLGHKPCLTELDRQIFDLLAVHAATALHCATLHAERRGALLA